VNPLERLAWWVAEQGAKAADRYLKWRHERERIRRETQEETAARHALEDRVWREQLRRPTTTRGRRNEP
jgi:hypothetical protein